jgi:hypothetical protein
MMQRKKAARAETTTAQPETTRSEAKACAWFFL